MKTKRYVLNACLSLGAVGALILGVTVPAHAATGTNADVETTASLNVVAAESRSGLTAAEEERLVEDVEVLFTRYVQLSGEHFRVNEQNLIADGHAADIQKMWVLAEGLNRLSGSSSTESSSFTGGPTIKPMGAGEFAICMIVNGLGIPAAAASPELIKVIKEGIRAWNWKLTAQTVARIVGPGVAKALGGPVGIGVALAWAAWSCRGQL